MAGVASGDGASTSAAPAPAGEPVLDATTGAGRRQPLKTRQFAALQGRVVGTFAARTRVAASGAAVDLLEAEDWWDPARPGRVQDGKHGFKARFPTPRGTLHIRPPKVRAFLLRVDTMAKQAGPQEKHYPFRSFTLRACLLRPVDFRARGFQGRTAKAPSCANTDRVYARPSVTEAPEDLAVAWDPERQSEIFGMLNAELRAELLEWGMDDKHLKKCKKPELRQMLRDTEKDADPEWVEPEEAVPKELSRGEAVHSYLKPPAEVDDKKLKIVQFSLCKGGPNAVCTVAVVATALLNAIPTVASVGGSATNPFIVAVSTMLPFMLQPSDPDAKGWTVAEHVVTTDSLLTNLTSLLPSGFLDVLRQADGAYDTIDAALVDHIQHKRLELPAADRPG